MTPDDIKQLGDLLRQESPPKIPVAVDHPVLDVLADVLAGDFGVDDMIMDVSRESECVEFSDRRTGKRYEIVVREID